MKRMDGHKKTTPELFCGGGLAAFTPLNRLVFVKRKDNLLSAGADHVLNITLYPDNAIKPFVRGKTHMFFASFSVFSIF